MRDKAVPEAEHAAEEREQLARLSEIEERPAEYDYHHGIDMAEYLGQLFDKLADLIDFLIPLYVREGKSQLVIAFGCTGGKHRSITFTELMAEHLAGKDYKVQKYHRDITKDKKFV